jgi:PAS domain S-box-containing protein
MGIRRKLLTSFLAVISVLIIAGGFFAVMDSVLLSKYKSLADGMISEYSLIGATSQVIESFKDLIKFPANVEKRSVFSAARQELKTLLIKLDGTIIDYDSELVYRGLRTNINGVIAETDAGVSQAAAGDYSDITAHYDAANRKNAFVKDNTASLLLAQLEYAKKLQAEIDYVRVLSQAIALWLFIMIVLGCVWYAVRFSRTLIAPLGHLTQLAKKIESGDLTAAVSPESLRGRDEVASLANSFNTMVFFLRGNIHKLQESNLEVKKASRRLSAEKRKLQQYLDVAGVIVLIFDFNNNILLMNKKGREILGFVPAEIIGKDWISLFVAKAQRLKTKTFVNFILADAASADTIENMVIAKDGTERNIVWHFSPLKSEGGRTEAILATGADVTELTKAKVTISQLKEVDKLKNEVLNIATHELKTPLISIVGLSEVMVKDPKTMPADYQKYIAIIHQEGSKLTDLIQTMLTVSRNELGQATMIKEKLDLAELLLSLETSLLVLAQRTGSRISISVPAGEKFNLVSDKAKISQVLYNLVDNAVKYGPKGQTVAIALSRLDAKFAKVEVHGAGPGITPADQKRLFLKFSQLEPSLSRSQDGMGLGLYICKQNVENLGGKIGIVTAPGQGTTFHFTLPLSGK